MASFKFILTNIYLKLSTNVILVILRTHYIRKIKKNSKKVDEYTKNKQNFSRLIKNIKSNQENINLKIFQTEGKKLFENTKKIIYQNIFNLSFELPFVF